MVHMTSFEGEVINIKCSCINVVKSASHNQCVHYIWWWICFLKCMWPPNRVHLTFNFSVWCIGQRWLFLVAMSVSRVVWCRSSIYYLVYEIMTMWTEIIKFLLHFNWSFVNFKVMLCPFLNTVRERSPMSDICIWLLRLWS